MYSVDHYKQVIEKKYNEIFEVWYRNNSQVPKAEIVLEISGADSGYSDLENKIYVRLLEGNLGDFKKTNYLLIPKLWETHLLHEMLHEYQFKVLKESSSEGSELFINYQIDECRGKLHNGVLGFKGAGHNELFYTAISIFYKNYTDSVEEFINHFI